MGRERSGRKRRGERRGRERRRERRRGRREGREGVGGKEREGEEEVEECLLLMRCISTHWYPLIANPTAIASTRNMKAKLLQLVVNQNSLLIISTRVQ